MGFRKLSGKPRRRRIGTKKRKTISEKGAVGVCSSCGKLSFRGFKCCCKFTECTSCWFKRTGGFSNPKSPEWHCPECGRVIIYDQEMNFIKRWSKEQWKRWNALGEGLQREGLRK